VVQISKRHVWVGNRFAGLRLEDFQGDMANLCKDQHGCRFLQRKLEEGSPLYRDMIFAEVYPHFAELMVDSFGNYLAQRLLEFSTDEQKDILLESIHDDLIQISLNMLVTLIWISFILMMSFSDMALEQSND